MEYVYRPMPSFATSISLWRCRLSRTIEVNNGRILFVVFPFKIITIGDHLLSYVLKYLSFKIT
jgi:hypothetical protein